VFLVLRTVRSGPGSRGFSEIRRVGVEGLRLLPGALSHAGGEEGDGRGGEMLERDREDAPPVRATLEALRVLFLALERHMGREGVGLLIERLPEGLRGCFRREPETVVIATGMELAMQVVTICEELVHRHARDLAGEKACDRASETVIEELVRGAVAEVSGRYGVDARAHFGVPASEEARRLAESFVARLDRRDRWNRRGGERWTHATRARFCRRSRSRSERAGTGSPATP
jgi:hypothetical protein